MFRRISLASGDVALVSFLAGRSIGVEPGSDVYILVDREISDRVFWITYGAIRGHFSLVTEVDEWLVRDRYYRTPIDSQIAVQRGYSTLCQYIVGLRDGKSDLRTYGVIG